MRHHDDVDYGPEIMEVLQLLQMPESDGSLKRATVTITGNALAIAAIMQEFLDGCDHFQHDDTMQVEIEGRIFKKLHGSACGVCGYETPKGHKFCEDCLAEHPGIEERWKTLDENALKRQYSDETEEES